MKNKEIDIYIVSDTHFEHKKIKDYENRPDNFNELIVKNWNDIVKDEDIVIHLGDVSFGDEEVWNKYIPNLKGKKILVRGNHDTKSDTWYIKHGIMFMCEELIMKKYGKTILFSHRPKLNLSEEYDVNIHGHCHGSGHRDTTLTNRHILIALELNGYKPQHLRKLLSVKTKPN